MNRFIIRAPLSSYFRDRYRVIIVIRDFNRVPKSEVAGTGSI